MGTTLGGGLTYPASALTISTTGATPPNNVANLDTFVPELWVDEVLAAYKANYVMPQLVTTMNFVGKKGDTIHLPKPNRGTVAQKVPNETVTLQADVSGEFLLTIDQHWEYSRLIEDILGIQAIDTFRAFYTDDAGEALAEKVDSDLHAEAAKFNGAGKDNADPRVASSAYGGAVIGSDGETVWDPSASANTGNGAAMADSGIRRMIRRLDDNNVPSRERVFVIPPVEKESLLGIQRFTEQAFTGEVAGGNSIRNGLVGDLYGIPVYVSTNCATVAADDTTTNYRVGVLMQKDAIVHAEQLAPRAQTQYKQEYLADLFTTDMLYGNGVKRPESGIAFFVPA